jgi:hypothetical protein
VALVAEAVDLQQQMAAEVEVEEVGHLSLYLAVAMVVQVVVRRSRSVEVALVLLRVVGAEVQVEHSIESYHCLCWASLGVEAEEVWPRQRAVQHVVCLNLAAEEVVGHCCLHSSVAVEVDHLNSKGSVSLRTVVGRRILEEAKVELLHHPKVFWVDVAEEVDPHCLSLCFLVGVQAPGLRTCQLQQLGAGLEIWVWEATAREVAGWVKD